MSEASFVSVLKDFAQVRTTIVQSQCNPFADDSHLKFKVDPLNVVSLGILSISSQYDDKEGGVTVNSKPAFQRRMSSALHTMLLSKRCFVSLAFFPVFVS